MISEFWIEKDVKRSRRGIHWDTGGNEKTTISSVRVWVEN